MGTGPYETVKLDPTSGAEFKANPNYWDGKVAFKELDVKFFDTETNAAIALRAKSIDLVPGVANAKSFESTSKAKIVSGPSCSMAFVGAEHTSRAVERRPRASRRCVRRGPHSVRE